MKNKQLFRYVAYLLACVTVLSVFVQPAMAKSADDIANTGLIQVKIENSYTVSKVHRSSYYSSTEIGCFKNGTLLTVLDETREFYKVDCFDMVGYIAKSQVSVNENGEYYVNCVKGSDETKYLPYYNMQTALALRRDVLDVAKKYLGVPYVSGGTGRWGFDCSGYTQYVFAQVGVSILRHERAQMEHSIIIPKEEMQCGDLVIFSNTGDNGGFASHIGIYVGNNQVIHASSSKGITISDLDSYYYAKHYQCSRRILLAQEAPAVSIPVSGIIQNAGNSFWRDGNESDSPFLTN